MSAIFLKSAMSPLIAQLPTGAAAQRTAEKGQKATWSPNASVCAVAIYFESSKELRAAVYVCECVAALCFPIFGIG
jgi:hypothetical protein